MTEHQPHCRWCNETFAPRTRGKQTKQYFCSTPCRNAFHKAARIYGIWRASVRVEVIDLRQWWADYGEAFSEDYR